VRSDTIRLDGITVNAPDALALAEFYAEITDGRATGTSRWAAATGPNALIAFQQVDDFRAPTWPDTSRPMLMHLEFFVEDLTLTGARALAAGATRFAFQPNSDHCFVYADPVGHPFCLSTWEARLLVDSALRTTGESMCRNP
jgi:hypothetical protein